MSDTLTQKQERYALNLFEGMHQREAYIQAGYSEKASIAVQDVNACRLADNTKVVLRIKELNQKAEDAAISTEKERRKILTKIQRATIGDFVDESGHLKLSGKELTTPAIAEIKTESTLIGVRTTLKLRDPVGAIAEHNKMDHTYEVGGNTYNDIKVLIVREKPKELPSGTEESTDINETP